MCLFPVHFIASFSGHRLWPVSFLLFGHRQWRPLSVVFIHYVISLGTACGDLVFCSVTDFCPSSGTASGDPLVPFDFITSFLWAPPVATHFSVVRPPPVATIVISFHRMISVRTACGDSVFCCHTYIHNASSPNTIGCKLSRSNRHSHGSQDRALGVQFFCGCAPS